MTRKLRWFGSAAALLEAAALAVASFAGSAHAAELRVVSSPGVKLAITELTRPFESETGHKLVVDFDVFAVLKNRINAGEKFDVAILSPALVEELIEAGKIDAYSRTTLGRIGMGLAVRKGGPRPDISTGPALRQALLNSKSIAYSRDGDSGKIFLAALDRLGIANQIKPKLRAVDVTTQAVVNGDAEFGFTGVGLILADNAVDLVGSLPPELQSYVVFTLGASASAREPEATRALIDFLTGPSAGAVLKQYGLEPGVR